MRDKSRKRSRRSSSPRSRRSRSRSPASPVGRAAAPPISAAGNSDKRSRSDRRADDDGGGASSQSEQDSSSRSKKRKSKSKKSSKSKSKKKKSSDSKRKHKKRSSKHKKRSSGSDDDENSDSGSSGSDSDGGRGSADDGAGGKKKKQRAGEVEGSALLFGYNKEDNPFHDPNLDQQFVWKKKIERDIREKRVDPKKALSKEYMAEELQRRRQEIEQVRERRTRREQEKADLEQLKAEVERAALFDDSMDWKRQEDDWEKVQAKERTKQRILAGREKPIDLLAKNVTVFASTDENERDRPVPVSLEIDLTEPVAVFEGLEKAELVDLRADIDMYLQMGNDYDYWAALLTVCDDELSKARRAENSYASSDAGRNLRHIDGVHASIRQDIEKIFGSKTRHGLDEMEEQIARTIAEAGSSQAGSIAAATAAMAGIHEPVKDVEYWEALLKQLTVFKAKAYLREYHADLLRDHLEKLKKHHLLEMRARASGFAAAAAAAHKTEEEEAAADAAAARYNAAPPAESAAAASADTTDQAPVAAVDSVPLSPRLFALSDVERDIPGLVIVTPEEDAERLRKARLNVVLAKRKQELDRQAVPVDLGQQPVMDSASAVAAAGISRFATDVDIKQDLEQRKNLAKVLGVDDEFEDSFDAVADVGGASQYWWHDKYRPRKPRYFNRVKTGFDWNKYNQVHYDKENPPPKVVQGYKFNIFYPDLIDATKPPTFKIERDPTNSDLAVIRFMAGPPYEDIAFKIVNKEWEFSHKRGYKCSFDRGVLHLYFNFRRYFYRK